MAKKNIDYPQSAKQILELVGGKENVASVTHCMMRVRLNLKDPALAAGNKDQIAATEGVMQVVEAGGQLQVVIGTTVEKMYNEIVALAGTGGGEITTAEDDAPEKKKGIGNAIMQLVSGIMMRKRRL